MTSPVLTVLGTGAHILYRAITDVDRLLLALPILLCPATLQYTKPDVS
jgi:hypothetical protein